MLPYSYLLTCSCRRCERNSNVYLEEANKGNEKETDGMTADFLWDSVDAGRNDGWSAGRPSAKPERPQSLGEQGEQ